MTEGGYSRIRVEPSSGALGAEVFEVDLSKELDGETFAAVANLGTRPTFGSGEHSLEVHLLDFDRDLYGRELEVTFRQLLRDERRFEGPDELKAQIALDVARARECLQA